MPRFRWLLFTALLGSAVSASARAAGAHHTPTPSPSPTPEATATPADTPMPGPLYSTPTPGPVEAPTDEPVSYRPQGKSLGIGAGYTFPTNIETPNTVTARLRLDSGLTIEPGVQVDLTDTKVSGGGGEGGGAAFNFIIGTAVRKPLYGRSQVDIVGILNPALTINSTSNKDPATGAHTSSTTYGIGTGWGLGVEYWVRPHWSISANATNPLLNASTNLGKTDGVKATTTTLFVGADWNPTVAFLTHIYY